MIGKGIPCEEEKRCYFEEWYKKTKYCRALLDPDDRPPYMNGKCKFYKKTRDSYSGSHEGEEYSPELVDKIRNAEYEFKLRKGIIGKRGRVI